jgi:phage terminase small subunit
MNTPRKHKYELFAQAIARGLKPHEAYVEAGFSKKGSYQGASRLQRVPEVAARIAELLKDNDRLASLTRKEFLREIERRFLTVDRTTAAAVRYAELLTKLRGWAEGAGEGEAPVIRIRIGGERPTDWITVDQSPALALGNVIETDATEENATNLSR